jgi:hydroxyacylglutathione hydrolase
MKIHQINPSITVFESSLYRTTTTVIGFENAVLIVDPNWLPDEIENTYQYIDKQHHGKEQYLLFTHSDYDHIIGYERFDGAAVIASAAFVENESKSDVIQQIVDFDNEYYIERSYPISYPKVDIVISKPHQSIYIDRHELIFYNALGHTKDGLFTIIPQKKCWIAGDYLSNIEIPFIDFNSKMYEKTLILARNILIDHPYLELLIPGHGDVAFSKDEIKKRIENDIRYFELLKECILHPNTITENKIQAHLLLYSSNPTMKTAHQKNVTKSK